VTSGLPCNCAAFSTDGSLLAVGMADLVTLWDPWDNALLGSLQPPLHNAGCPISRLAFIPGTPFLAACSEVLPFTCPGSLAPPLSFTSALTRVVCVGVCVRVCVCVCVGVCVCARARALACTRDTHTLPGNPAHESMLLQLYCLSLFLLSIYTQPWAEYGVPMRG
jgi:hypothetical protein